MSKLIKVFFVGISYVLVAAMAINGSLAFLQDQESDVNVMTTGNVYIRQHEFERGVNDDGTYQTVTTQRGIGYKLVDFTQDKPLYPATGEIIGWDSTRVYFDQFGEGHELGAMDVLAGLNNVQDKFVFVENTGDCDAYVRTLIAYEIGSMSNAYTDGYVMTSVNLAWKVNEIGAITVDGNNYYLVEYIYDGNFYNEDGTIAVENGNARHPDGIVHPGEWTYCSLAQVYLAGKASNQDLEAIDGNDNGTYDIIVVSQAVQASGFDNAEAALDAGFGDCTIDNFPYDNTVIIYTDDQPKFMKAHEEGKRIIICTDILHITEPYFDGKGAEVTLDGIGTGRYAYLAFAPGKGKDITVENLSVVGSGFVEMGHYKEGGGTYIANNLSIKNVNATLCIYNGDDSVAAAFTSYGKATLTDCVMFGATANLEGFTAYDAGFTNGTKTFINGGYYGSIYVWHQAHMTVNNAKIDYIRSAAITLNNLGKLTVGEGADIGTICLAPDTYAPSLVVKDGAVVDVIDLSEIVRPDKVKITIEDGATIGAFVDNGVEYATLDAWRAAQ